LKYPEKASRFLGLKKSLFKKHSSIILGYLFEPWVEIWRFFTLKFGLVMAIENLQQAHGFKVKSPKKNSLHIIFSYLV
jgi:hypothetical protein